MLFSDVEGKISNEVPQVSFLDHGFLFGDSLYEVVRVYKRKYFGWNEHIERLRKSGKRVGIDIDACLPTIEKRARELLIALGEDDAAIRIIVSRGVGKLHIDPRSCTKPTIFMAAWKFEVDAQPKEVSLAVVKIRRNPIESLDPAIKSGNYLNNVLALQEAIDAGADDALMLSCKGFISELTTSNLGWVSESGDVQTSHTETGILHGITRRAFLETFTAVIEGDFTVDALWNAREVFALSTFKEVVPVTAVRFLEGPHANQWKKYARGTKTIELQLKFRKMVEDRLQKTSVAF